MIDSENTSNFSTNIIGYKNVSNDTIDIIIEFNEDNDTVTILSSVKKSANRIFESSEKNPNTSDYNLLIIWIISLFSASLFLKRKNIKIKRQKY